MSVAVLLSVLASAWAAAAVRELGPASVWVRPGEEAARLERLHRECSSETNDRAGCMLAFMKREGASEAALEAARRISAGKYEPEGYLSAFEERGRVDFGYAAYPFAADVSLQGVLLNGTPSIVPLEQPGLRDFARGEKLLRDAGAAIFASDFGGSPDVLPRPEGGQRFEFEFRAAACRNCKNLSTVTATYDFDDKGAFVGVRCVRGVRVSRKSRRGASRGRGRTPLSPPR